ncbi:S1 RNA-binding domain-containing protein [Nonomuraea sp. NN258]|uniref:S1 RNA-binding domain-containing protein n=1 Tax=Nonomuraea antri TaxID=2730852 RepID=UPI001569C4DD|nr:S1 RNA-binding domain-containing protein [Nonomuraea antri]NRQ31859.1 S1 RNA-binding domain-containing protein [Nonomuraea antri]
MSHSLVTAFAGRTTLTGLALTRTHQPEKGVVFTAMPFGVKHFNGADGATCDFDKVYKAIEKTMHEAGLRPERLDGLYGPTPMIELISRAIQRAEFVLVDFTTKNHNVTFELAIALMFGKKVVMITQDLSHVPSDYQGHRVLTYSLMWDAMDEFKKALIEQLNALRAEPGTEQTLAPLPGPNHVVNAPATVIQAEREYAVVRMDDPASAPMILSNADVDYGRHVSDMGRLFKIGDRIDGALVVDTMKGSVRYTLLAGQEDPWPAIVQRFSIGTIFTGMVRRTVPGKGFFVEMTGEVNGFIPAWTLAGPSPAVGTQVEAKVIKVDAANRKITLRLTGAPVLDERRPADPLQGHRGYGRVVRAVPLKDGHGGYLLLEIEGRERPALLIAKHMSQELRDDLSEGQVELGEEIYVEVIHVDPAQDKVLLRELPDPEDEAEPAQAA